MKTIKRLAVIFAVIFCVGFILSRWEPPTVEPDAPPVLSDVDGALRVCETWTRNNAKLSVDTITDRYTLSKIKPQLPGDTMVGLDWRAQGSGLAMQSTCEVDHRRGAFVLVSGKSGVR